MNHTKSTHNQIQRCNYYWALSVNSLKGYPEDLSDSIKFIFFPRSIDQFLYIFLLCKGCLYCGGEKERKKTHTYTQKDMGSNYFGEQNYLGNERGAGGLSSSSSSSSSRKGKKNSSDKPKQPQRGLGVAQLEKIRLHSQLGCTYLPSSVHHNPYASNFNQVNFIIYIYIY